jgi:hypothetical protein
MGLAMAIMFATRNPTLVLKIGPKDSLFLVNKVLHLFNVKDGTAGQCAHLSPSLLPVQKLVLDYTASFKDPAHNRLCNMYKV